jgi:glutamate-1-semialdehyde 2,1-aminomutase
MSTRYQLSEQYLEQALRTVPLGSQTFSKSKTQLPVGAAPFFAERGKGSRLWDVDGNEYLDFVNALASITLGYQDPDVDGAVRKQMESGTIFSLPHRLEFEVAELMVDMVPCAEMVRFGKNGSDATAGAIRIARAYTGRDHVAVCGYHGWQDWYIGSTARNLGVPEATQRLTHSFTYNDIASLEAVFAEYPGKIAAVILEPMNISEPKPGFLEEVKAITHKNGAVLVFDEMLTGFRFANGGGQEYFGVTPDLATFGKGLANGYPLSAVAGRKEIMKLMEEVFFSFTFGGETLSLAAAKAVLEKLQREPVINTIKQRGETLLYGLNALIEQHSVQEIFGTAGNPCWSFLTIKDAEPYTMWEIKTLLFQEMFAQGVFFIGTHNLSYAHTSEDIQALLAVYDEVFPKIYQVIKQKKLVDMLECKPLEPLFKVR